VCGNVRDGAGSVIKSLTCGGLNIGGGGAHVPEATVPDASNLRFAMTCCDATGKCTIEPMLTPPAVNSADPDCTTTGCYFGTPLPIPNGPASTCVVNRWADPATGVMNLSDGTATLNVPLISDVYLVSVPSQPCPRCENTNAPGTPAVGSPASPATGKCDRGPDKEKACTTTSATGLTRDCAPDGSFINPDDPLRVTLFPLTTDVATGTAPDGKFCPNQPRPGSLSGCFGLSACRTIAEEGKTAGPLAIGEPANATLASVFCIPLTTNDTVDVTANLPGPGAVALPGTFTVR